jgi:hypothetical protein
MQRGLFIYCWDCIKGIIKMKLNVALLPLAVAWTPAIQSSHARISIKRQSAVSMAESEDVLRAKAYVLL